MAQQIIGPGRKSHLQLTGMVDKLAKARSIQAIILMYKTDGRATLKEAHTILLKQFNKSFDFHEASPDQALKDGFKECYLDVQDRRETSIKNDIEFCNNLQIDLEGLPEKMRRRRDN